MNAEYLLDAIGQLDDDLIREAERYRRPKARYGRLMGLAASFAVVILLGYFATHFGMGGGSGSAPANGGAAAPEGYSGAGSPSAAEDENLSGILDPQTPGESSPASGETPFDNPYYAPTGTVFVRGSQGSGTYILNGEVLAKLPEGGEGILLGKLLALGQDSPALYTNVEEYVGLNLWAENNGADLPTAVYVELPEGGFARAELAEP